MKKQKVWSSGRLVMKKAENIIVKFQLKVIRERNSNQHLINRCTGTELWLLADTNRRSPATDWQTKCCCAKRNPLRIRNGTHKLRLVTWTHDLQVPWLTLALLSATYWKRSLELFTITTMAKKRERKVSWSEIHQPAGSNHYYKGRGCCESRTDMKLDKEAEDRY